ncbi:MAG TPA: M23 family metallopeptidase, partial [Flavisolibacter sp.]|nr:M23 family metallopeptidase [Flavisolibacter sp.]
MADYVKQQQYARESWRVNLQIPANLFPVKKSEFIALSGNTGGSQGPHVHFEIRDTETEKCLNPLLFNFPVTDAVPPSILRLAMYDRNKSTYHQAPQIIGLKNTGASYTLASSNTIKVGSDKVSFALGTVDHLSGSTNPIGVYCAEIFLDEKPVSQFRLDGIDYNESRYINAQLDYPHKTKGGASLQHISPLPGAVTVPYSSLNPNGIIHLKDDAVHAIVIEVQDANKNTSRVKFNIQYDASLAKAHSTTDVEKLLPNNLNVFEEKEFELFTTEATVYDTVNISYSNTVASAANAVSALHGFLNATIPSHDWFTVRIKPSVSLTEEQKARIVIKNISGTKTFIEKATWKNGWLSAKFRQFGTYQAFIDNEPPTINAPATDLSKAGRIVFTPKDNFNSIKNFRAELNGQWLRFTNDKG